tara:strand:- start:1818 stop:2459 length:642 start_codon:yes stop_codon:yes gene_type:complete
MVWPFNNQQQAQPNGALSLGRTEHPQFAAPATAGVNPWGAGPAQPQQPNPFLSGMVGANAATYAAQPVAPPSEMEILAMLLHHQTPVDRFLSGPNLNLLVSIIANIVNLSLVEFFRNVKFTEDDDGKLCVDVGALPTQYQTLSAENVTADLNSLQASCNQAVQKSLTDQQQILQMASTSMMQGALDAALSDPGFLERIGGAVGATARGLTGMR